MVLGVQVDVYAERMTDTQLSIFCLVGTLATFCTGYLLTAFAKSICRAQNKLLRAMLYYITIALLHLDPLYLNVLCGLFGSGDMNGIALLCPEWAARCPFGALLLEMGWYSGSGCCRSTKSRFRDRKAEARLAHRTILSIRVRHTGEGPMIRPPSGSTGHRPFWGFAQRVNLSARSCFDRGWLTLPPFRGRRTAPLQPLRAWRSRAGGDRRHPCRGSYRPAPT